jgi:hypothetical protein
VYPPNQFPKVATATKILKENPLYNKVEIIASALNGINEPARKDAKNNPK